jgi:hypothetical protein
MLRSIVETLSESYGLEVEMEIEGNYAELRFNNLKLLESEMVESKLEEFPAFTGFSGTEIWAEIHLPSEIEEDGIDFNVKDLHLIFKTIVDVIDLESDHLEPEDSSESVLASNDVSLEKSNKTKVLKS